MGAIPPGDWVGGLSSARLSLVTRCSLFRWARAEPRRRSLWLTAEREDLLLRRCAQLLLLLLLLLLQHPLHRPGDTDTQRTGFWQSGCAADLQQVQIGIDAVGNVRSAVEVARRRRLEYIQYYRDLRPAFDILLLLLHQHNVSSPVSSSIRTCGNDPIDAPSPLSIHSTALKHRSRCWSAISPPASRVVLVLA